MGHIRLCKNGTGIIESGIILFLIKRLFTRHPFADNLVNRNGVFENIAYFCIHIINLFHKEGFLSAFLIGLPIFPFSVKQAFKPFSVLNACLLKNNF